MKYNRTAWLTIAAVLFAVLTAYPGCVKDKTGSQQKHAPAISNMQPALLSVPQGEGGGGIVIFGSVDFVDNGADVASITATYYDPRGRITHTTTLPLPDIEGHSSGTIDLDVAADTTEIGEYTLKIFITDRAGSSSNALTGTFQVIMSSSQPL